MFSDSIFECTYWQCYVELPAKYFITFYNTYTKYFLHTRPAAHCMQHFCAEVNGTCKLLIFFLFYKTMHVLLFSFSKLHSVLWPCAENGNSWTTIFVVVNFLLFVVFKLLLFVVLKLLFVVLKLL